ncbi:MAG: hypothetical protein ACYTEE_06015 [Planctomycetota bacterium]
MNSAGLLRGRPAGFVLTYHTLAVSQHRKVNYGNGRGEGGDSPEIPTFHKTDKVCTMKHITVDFLVPRPMR